MDNSAIVQIVLISWCAAWLIISFISFSWNRMILTIEFWWCVLLVMLIVLGSFEELFLWCNDFDLAPVLVLLGVVLLLTLLMFYLCKTVSMLVNRNQELAMQIALLNKDSEEMLKDLEINLEQTEYIKYDKINSTDKDHNENKEEKDFVRN